MTARAAPGWRLERCRLRWVRRRRRRVQRPGDFFVLGGGLDARVGL